jgi:geranylgeranyl diphosphate synthase type 3
MDSSSSSAAIQPHLQAPNSAPSFIPPRTSSHGVAFASDTSPPRASPSGKGISAPIEPPNRRSSKRPLSNTSENFLKNPDTVRKLKTAAVQSSPNHSHRPKSANRNDRTTGTILKFGSSSILQMAPGQPPQEPDKSIGDHLIQANKAPWSPEKEKILLGPFDFLFGHPGKDIRSQCIGAFNEWLQVPPERLAIITKVVGMLHTSSLL